MRRFFTAVAVLLTAGLSASAQSASEVMTGSYHDGGGRPWSETAAVNYDPSFWFTAEYLVWFSRNQQTIQLITSVPDDLVQPGGRVGDTSRVRNLYPSNRKIEFDAQNGLRISGGYVTRNGIGIDFSAFVLESITDGGRFSSPGSPSLARTYIRSTDRVQQNLYSALPGVYPGSATVLADTQFFGADANLRFDWYKMIVDRNDLLTGVRFLNLDESLLVSDRSDLSGGTVVNTTLDVARTRNKYYGAQVGLATRLVNVGGVCLDSSFKIGMGGVRQEVEIFGRNTLGNLPPENTGLYAQARNSGRFTRDQFAGHIEYGLNLGYSFNTNCRIQIGYNIIWLSSVVRPGQVFDPVVNDSNLRFVAEPSTGDTSRRPEFVFKRASSDFWAQGLSLGLTFSY